MPAEKKTSSELTAAAPQLSLSAQAFRRRFDLLMRVAGRLTGRGKDEGGGKSVNPGIYVLTESHYQSP